MGNTIMKNLEKENIVRDEGNASIDVIYLIEIKHKIRFPNQYIEFITKHNGARILARIFDYNDPNIKSGGKNADSIAFMDIADIQSCINDIISGEEPDWDIKYRFEDGLIPFGDNGGGDMICFDYRKDRSTDNPPIVIWNHDMGLDHRVIFIANSFEEFINMLHEPED